MPGRTGCLKMWCEPFTRFNCHPARRISFIRSALVNGVYGTHQEGSEQARHLALPRKHARG